MDSIQLFCLPYAGASARGVYEKWKLQMNKRIKIYPLELAGHGQRMQEPLNASVDEVVQEFLPVIKENIFGERPYALFGHSMGTILAYELALAIQKEQLHPPVTMFLSGRYPPHFIYGEKGNHLLPDKEFLHQLMKLGGTPAQFLQSTELLKIFLPVLRNDYRIINEHLLNAIKEKFDFDIAFFYSDSDDFVKDKKIAAGWAKYTNKLFSMFEFQGGHFFLNEDWKHICSIISKTLIKN